MFMTLLFDYRVSANGIYLMLFHAVPILVCRLDSIIGVETTSSWTRWYPPFRTLRLGNRPRRSFLAIHRRGFFKFLLLTPDDPQSFSHSIERNRRAAAGETTADGGFTLLETLVALTIVAIGFAIAFGAMPESLGAQSRAQNLEAATSLAEAALAQEGPADGVASRFAWHVDAAPLGSGRVVRVTVRWTEGQNARSITLQTFRLAGRAG